LRCKAIRDLFGDSPERGHKRLADGDGARGWGFEGRTLDVEDATLYVLSSWHDKQDFKVATLQQRTWKRQERAWKSEDMREEERTFRMGTTSEKSGAPGHRLRPYIRLVIISRPVPLAYRPISREHFRAD
jgi:hypothetical protein